MPRRNVILVLIVSTLVIGGLLAFLYYQSKKVPPESGEGTNFIARFNPFKSNVPPQGEDIPPVTETQPPAEIPPEETSPLKLKKISSVPIAGFGLFKKERFKEVAVPPPPAAGAPEVLGTTTDTKKAPLKKPTAPPTEFATAVRYIERATGNIYQTFVDKIEERKFSTTVIPKIYDAYWGSGGDMVVMRHLKPNGQTIETIVGTLPKEKLGEDLETNQIKAVFLTDDIRDISLSGDGTKIFYLISVNGGAFGTSMNIADGKKTQIFESAFTEWLSTYPNKNTVALTTKPSGVAVGYMYALDVAKKAFTRVLGPINGLTTLMSPDGKKVLYSNGALTLSLYTIATKESVPLGVRTLPEKCVWSNGNEVVYCAVPDQIPNGIYPDSWYQGEVSFRDKIWKINTEDGSAKIIADPTALVGEDIDSIKLALDADEYYLFFVNKKDSFLWEFDLRP